MQHRRHKQATGRFDATREAILAEATEVLSEGSPRGITLNEVASRVGLKTSSITYYFPRRDALIAACIDRTLDRLDSLLVSASNQSSPRASIAALIDSAFERMTRRLSGEEPPLASLSYIPSLRAEDQSRIVARWRDSFRQVRALIEPPSAGLLQTARSAAEAHVLLNELVSLYMWATLFEADQHSRLAARLSDVLLNGIAAPGSAWVPLPLDPDRLVYKQPGLPDFLRVATRMINERGYHGTSISKVAAEINLTKGSFYHHLDTKEALVLACFDRSLETMAAAYHHSAAAADSWQRLISMVAALVSVQFSGQSPLLHSSAISAIPDAAGQRMTDRAVASARRLEGLISDCIADGSARPVDAFVASQALLSMINSAADFIGWSRTLPHDEAVRIYAGSILYGMVRAG